MEEVHQEQNVPNLRPGEEGRKNLTVVPCGKVSFHPASPWNSTGHRKLGEDCNFGHA